MDLTTSTTALNSTWTLTLTFSIVFNTGRIIRLNEIPPELENRSCRSWCSFDTVVLGHPAAHPKWRKREKNCDTENSEVFQLVGLQMSEMRIAFVLRNLKFYSSGLLPTSRFAFCFSFMEIIDSPLFKWRKCLATSITIGLVNRTQSCIQSSNARQSETYRTERCGNLIKQCNLKNDLSKVWSVINTLTYSLLLYVTFMRYTAKKSNNLTHKVYN